MAMVSLGCDADANPELRLKLKYTTLQGKQVADDRLLTITFRPVTKPPIGRLKMIELPYEHIPTIQEFRRKTNARGSEGYFARLALDR